MKIAIHQPNFLPWIGYFNKISLVDTFVLFDDVQLERGKSYTQRTKILVGQCEKWITIPVINKSDLILIKDAQVDSSFIWKRKILKTIEFNYANSPGFEEIIEIIRNVFKSDSKFLIDYNIPLIIEIARYMGLKTNFILSSEITPLSGKKGMEKILGIIKHLRADVYISGKGEGSKRYINDEELSGNGIKLLWQQFKFMEYPQNKSVNFIQGLSIIDLVMNCAKESKNYLK
ncbi:MAG TPA: WbqC family protein [Ignavibacteria bacterium]